MFGSTARASDIRILISFVFNLLCVVATLAAAIRLGFIEALLISGALAFLSSHNLMFNIGIVKPFQVVNEKYL